MNFDCFWQDNYDIQDVKKNINDLLKKETNLLKLLQLYVVSKHLKMDIELDVSQFQNVRWHLKDDENIEIICLFYEHAPHDVQCFIDQIRKHKITNIHSMKCDIHNITREQIIANYHQLPIVIQNLYLFPNNILNDLLYHKNISHLYINTTFLTNTLYRSIICKFEEKPTCLFLYDNLHIPTAPNDTFKKELFESIDNVIFFGTKRDIELLKMHCFFVYCFLDLSKEYDFGIVCKMHQLKWKLQNSHVFKNTSYIQNVHVLTSIAHITKKYDIQLFTHYINQDYSSEHVLLAILYLLLQQE